MIKECHWKARCHLFINLSCVIRGGHAAVADGPLHQMPSYQVRFSAPER